MFSRIALCTLVLAASGCVATSSSAPAGGASALPFRPSNVPVDKIDFTNAGDVVVGAASCGIDTDVGAIGCATGGNAVYVPIDQPAGPGVVGLGVFLVKSFTVPTGVELRVRGKRALVVIAQHDLDVEGTILVNAVKSEAYGGGFVNTDVNAAGAGPGGGSAGSTTTSAAGGTFCGLGGDGAGVDGAPAAKHAPSYGNPELVPLVAGSSGGQGTVGQAGAGGGAVELVAFGKLTIGDRGVVHAGGGGGAPGGGPAGQNASGGGSGGAILLEGSHVFALGTLAANGGGGGEGSVFQYGDDATPDASFALGGNKDGAGIAVGGNGGAGKMYNATAGTTSPATTAGGGGGGIGRIRINALGAGIDAGPKTVFSPTDVIDASFAKMWQGPGCLTYGSLEKNE